MAKLDDRKLHDIAITERSVRHLFFLLLVIVFYDIYSH